MPFEQSSLRLCMEVPTQVSVLLQIRITHTHIYTQRQVESPRRLHSVMKRINSETVIRGLQFFFSLSGTVSGVMVTNFSCSSRSKRMCNWFWVLYRRYYFRLSDRTHFRKSGRNPFSRLRRMYIIEGSLLI